MINTAISKLVYYAIEKKLIEKEDEIYIVNSLLHALNLESYEKEESNGLAALEDILREIDDYACEQGTIGDTVTERDLFDTYIMGLLIPRPSEVIRKFNELYKKSPKDAMQYFYSLSLDSNYIRTYRVNKDMKWVTQTEYGELDITINLSKPEKDSKSILAAKNSNNCSYPKCALCIENEGYAGRLNHPARQNIRLIPVRLNNEDWKVQYSPYVYYNEHCIVLNNKHIPMKVDKNAIIKLFDFVKIFPHYFIGSNAGLPIVGGSILAHEHFQGGNYEFAMTKAPIEKEFVIKGYEDVKTGMLKWPMSVIRISCKDERKLIELGSFIMDKWHGYTDESVNIYANTNGEDHNAITPIARKNGDYYVLDLVLRNNITTEECPDGLFHPHKDLQHIKKENIGLIEVMGLAILPPRLKTEMEILKDYMLNKKDIKSNERIEKHFEWAEEIKARNKNINSENIDEIMKCEIGQVFLKVLLDAGVFKRNSQGKAAFEKFIETLR